MKYGIVFGIAMTVWAQSGDDKLSGLLQDRAMFEAVSRMKTDDRVAMYEALGRAKPEDGHYQMQMAATYLQKMRETMDPGYLTRATKLVDSALSNDPKNYEALRLKSAIELERHDFPEVERHSRRLIEIAPDDPWNWGTLGDALMELGKYSDAADAYQTMVRLRPDMSSYNRAAYYRFVAGDAAGAIEIMKRAIEAGSRSPENVAWCLVDLGNMELKVGRAAEAELAFQTALKLFPGYHPANAGLGRYYAQQGKTALAIEHYTKAADAVPMPEYAAALEDLYEAAGRPEEAKKQAARLAVIERMDQAAGFPANRNLALAYADRGRNVDRALAMLREEMKSRRDVYEQDALAWVLYQNKRYQEAAQASAKAMELNTPEPAFYFHAGLIAKASGDSAKAREFLAKALELNPQFQPRQADAARAALKEMSK
jgi:tetratricopeptide (TPR) repeat protein